MKTESLYILDTQYKTIWPPIKFAGIGSKLLDSFCKGEVGTPTCT